MVELSDVAAAAVVAVDASVAEVAAGVVVELSEVVAAGVAVEASVAEVAAGVVVELSEVVVAAVVDTSLVVAAV
ncbi:MAG: hypothetical protein ACTH6K_03540 [Lactococcus cremoris]